MLGSVLRQGFGNYTRSNCIRPNVLNNTFNLNLSTSKFVNSSKFTRSLHTSLPRFYGHKHPNYVYLFGVTCDKPLYGERYLEWEIMPRDEFGIPAHIPPDISTLITHTYYVPPQYYPFLKRIGDETPELKPWCDKMIKGQLSFADYEEMFYKNAKPLKVYRNRIPLPYRSEAEVAKSAEVYWEGKWLSYRQRVAAEYRTRQLFRDFLVATLVGLFWTQIWMSQVAIYNDDMRLFYLEAPEHKINWVVPRGDL